MRIIPAIDIIEGKCVRLTKGDYDTRKIYNEDPLEIAKSFEGAGLKYLHLVDLDGAKKKRIVNWKVLEKLATRTNPYNRFWRRSPIQRRPQNSIRKRGCTNHWR